MGDCFDGTTETIESLFCPVSPGCGLKPVECVKFWQRWGKCDDRETEWV